MPTKRQTAILTFALITALLALGFLSKPVAAQDNYIYPVDVVQDAEGTIYVADRNLPGIWKIQDGKREVFFQGSKKFRTPLNAVRCLGIDHEGRLLAGDSSTREVYRFVDGQPQALTNGGIGIPMGLAVNADGEIFVSDLELHRIWKVPAAGGEPQEVAQVAAPIGMFLDNQNRLWIVSRGDDQLIRLVDGQAETVVMGNPMQFPHDVVVAEDQTAYVTDGYGKSV